MLLPARFASRRCHNLPTPWGPNVQIHESIRDISYSTHNKYKIFSKDKAIFRTQINKARTENRNFLFAN